MVWRFIHKILAKYCQKLILMSIFCQFPSLNSSIYWQIQYNTKKLKKSIFWNHTSDFLQTKTIMISILSLTWWIYSNDPTASFYFPETFLNFLYLVNTLLYMVNQSAAAALFRKHAIFLQNAHAENFNSTPILKTSLTITSENWKRSLISSTFILLSGYKLVPNLDV